MLVYSIGSRGPYEKIRTIQSKLHDHLLSSCGSRQNQELNDRKADSFRKGAAMMPITVVDINTWGRSVRKRTGQEMTEKFGCVWTEFNLGSTKYVEKAFELMIKKDVERETQGKKQDEPNSYTVM